MGDLRLAFQALVVHADPVGTSLGEVLPEAVGRFPAEFEYSQQELHPSDAL